MEHTTDKITVTGIHEYDLKGTYSTKMIVSLQNVIYDGYETGSELSLKEIKDAYAEKLVDAGIAGTQKGELKEDLLSYSLLGYEKEGTVISYATDSLDMAQKFLMVKSNGVMKSESTFTSELTKKQMTDYAHSAFLDAQDKASALAERTERKLGRILIIDDHNLQKTIDGFYSMDYLVTREYRVTISFELL
ncbi:hypothetical protein FEE95_16490 [Maribacter algarum]|uniref:SIMPL domain-containing protein n=1 Tax=Maribacter algarum (ex Zhang et al. 2020) TaxID=2578118 RepID=A0A5S3PNZ9_9FLAO|nr:hypothetical protein [Maribacter algarum]TMM56219.1 hypothetical protein FEE95_16490 [Maribacter algarum]